LRVALILTPDTLSNARYTKIAGRAHSTVDSGRAMGLGGTGLLWGGQLSELSAADVTGDKGFWPITHAELRALYERVYAALGLPPRMDDATARALATSKLNAFAVLHDRIGLTTAALALLGFAYPQPTGESLRI
jgi:hypothetical protein